MRIPLTFREKFIGLYLLVFQRVRFYERAARHDKASDAVKSEMPEKQFPGLAYSAGDEAFKERAIKRTRLLGRRIRVSLTRVIVAITVGWFIALVWSRSGVAIPSGVRAWLLVLSMGIFVGATFARLGWEGQSWKADTYVEQIDLVIFRLSCMVGVAIGTFATLVS